MPARLSAAVAAAVLLLLAAAPPPLATTAAAAASSADVVDGHYEGTMLRRLAFGSCNKQWRNNTLWGPIVAFQPQAFLWLGDAVYVKEREGDNEANLRRAYTRQLASPGYQRLLATGAVVEGVYDDHDMSTNDGHRVVRALALVCVRER
jgi:alkaline phosphatase D